jgi:Astacin (Peptidase family M12A)
MSEYEKYRETLARIAELASAAINENGSTNNGGRDKGSSDRASQERRSACTLRQLPPHLHETAARTAMEINPVNAPLFTPVSTAADLFLDRARITLATRKYWGPTPRRLSVSFLESTPSDLRRRIVSHLNAWTQTGCIEFAETQGTGEVRISRSPDGYWSYLGTDILQIPPDQPTMNLEAFSMSTPDSEFHRVVRHEAGHTLGLEHEHMRRELVGRINPEKAYAYFLRTQGWDRRTVDQQVLTPLDESSILGTPADQDSIMCYQLPGSITRDGNPIVGGTDIDRTDFDFIGRIYPKVNREQFAERGEWNPAYASA